MENEVKDERAEIIKKLIDEKWTSQKAFAESIDIPYTTLRSILKRGVGNASVNNVIKVCEGLGITVDELQKMSGNEYEPETIAAHHEGEEWTEEELKEVEAFKSYLRSKRKGGN